MAIATGPSSARRRLSLEPRLASRCGRWRRGDPRHSSRSRAPRSAPRRSRRGACARTVRTSARVARRRRRRRSRPRSASWREPGMAAPTSRRWTRSPRWTRLGSSRSCSLPRWTRCGGCMRHRMGGVNTDTGESTAGRARIGWIAYSEPRRVWTSRRWPWSRHSSGCSRRRGTTAPYADSCARTSSSRSNRGRAAGVSTTAGGSKGAGASASARRLCVG